MIDIANEEFWDAKYESEVKSKPRKVNTVNKIIMIGLIFFIIALTTNIILLYNFFNLLSEI